MSCTSKNLGEHKHPFSVPLRRHCECRINRGKPTTLTPLVAHVAKSRDARPKHVFHEEKKKKKRAHLEGSGDWRRGGPAWPSGTAPQTGVRRGPPAWERCTGRRPLPAGLGEGRHPGHPSATKEHGRYSTPSSASCLAVVGHVCTVCSQRINQWE